MGTNLRVAALVLVILGVYTLVANMIPQVESEVPQELSFASDVTPEQLVTAGDQLYQGAGGCTACHGLGTRAPNLLTDEGGKGAIGARCGQRVQGEDCKTYLHRSMTEPAAYVVEGYQPIMPDLRRTLSGSQIWALVAYLQSLGGEVTVTAEDVAKEEKSTDAAGATSQAGGAAFAGGSNDPHELINAAGCLTCHRLGTEGQTIAPPFDSIGARRNAESIRRKILNPRADTTKGYEPMAGIMPPTYGQQLNGSQLEALVTFLAGQK